MRRILLLVTAVALVFTAPAVRADESTDRLVRGLFWTGVAALVIKASIDEQERVQAENAYIATLSPYDRMMYKKERLIDAQTNYYKNQAYVRPVTYNNYSYHKRYQNYRHADQRNYYYR